MGIRKKHHFIRNLILILFVVGVIFFVGGMDPSTIAAKAGDAPGTISEWIDNGTAAAFLAAIASGIRDFALSVANYIRDLIPG